MNVDRNKTLDEAARASREGRLEEAVAGYSALLRAQPDDWSTANLVGDLYVRIGRPDKAKAQYLQLADRLFQEGFLARAAAIYRKLLKLGGDEGHARLRLAEIAIAQGRLVDAKNELSALSAGSRRRRGDAVGTGDVELRLAELEMRAGNLKGGGQVLERLLDTLPGADVTVTRRAVELAETNADVAFRLVERVADRATYRDDWPGAVEAWRTLSRRLPTHVATQVRLVETCVDAGLTDELREPQVGLLAAYNAAGLDSDARLLADDLATASVPESDEPRPEPRSHADERPSPSSDGHRSDVPNEPSGEVPDEEPDGSSEVSLNGEKLAWNLDWSLDWTLDQDENNDENKNQDRDQGQGLDQGLAIGLGLDLDDADQAQDLAQDLARDHQLDQTPVEAPDEVLDVTFEERIHETPGEYLEASTDEDHSGAPPAYRDYRIRSVTAVLAGERGPGLDGQAGDAPQDHYRLATSLLERGEVERGVQALERAVSSSGAMRCEAASLLGELAAAAGDRARAIEWYEVAVAESSGTQPDHWRVWYELGRLLEEHGETLRAVAVFMELEVQTGGYRDAADRLRCLGSEVDGLSDPELCETIQGR